MLAVFFVGSVLVTAAGFQLFILTEQTARWFAWTIQAPMSAAFLGAFYFTALAVAWRSARKRTWSEARVGVLGVFVFITLTFVLTVLHRDKFHFSAASAAAKGAAYGWFFVYLIDPVFVAVAWIFQLRQPGSDPPRRLLLPAWYRGVLLVQGVALLLIGALLWLTPATMAAEWPWSLTPLTARAIGAWLLGFGLLGVSAAWENAWERIDVATLSYVVLGTLLLIALTRYRATLDWSNATAWLYVAALVSVALVGVYGWRAGTRAQTASRSPSPAAG